MFLGIPTLGEKADISMSDSMFKINGYRQFVETQSIRYGSYRFNGNEGTMTEYGHSRVTADLGRWPVVEVFVLDPDCCVVY